MRKSLIWGKRKYLRDENLSFIHRISGLGFEAVGPDYLYFSLIVNQSMRDCFAVKALNIIKSKYFVRGSNRLLNNMYFR